ncbi:MAG TPA: hypothetical protein VGG63_14910 [Steroidobacteraceae bacterium]|jgi:hypothetical protein
MRQKIVEVAAERTDTRCTAYLPVRVALTLSGSTQDVLAALQDLLDLTGTISYAFDARNVAIRFDLAEYPDFFQEYAEVPIKGLARGYVMLRATAESEHVVGHFYDPETGAPSLNVSFEDRLDASKYSAAEELKKALFELVLASNLARPGILMPEGGAIFCDGVRRVAIPKWVNPVAHAIQETHHVNWPSTKTIPFSTVWNWLRDVPGFKDGIGNTELGRAIAAFSYLFGNSIDGAHPFLHGLWAILGLEAIYGEGTELITRLLVERTNAFLGLQTSHKKALKEMYSFRSTFLHGDMNIPFAHCAYHGAELIELFHDRATEPEALAVRVLVATLQKMAEEQRHLLSFRTEVNPPQTC